MSDDFLAEVKEDIQKERLILIVKRYWLHFFVSVTLILGSVLLYDYYKQSNERHARLQSDIFYEISSNVNSDYDIDFKDLDNKYQPLLINKKYSFLLEEGRLEEAKKLISNYINDTPYNKDKIINYAHSFMALNHLGSAYDTFSLGEYEKLIKDYARTDGAFSFLSYELMVVKSLQEKNIEKSEYYLDLMTQRTNDATVLHRVKAYKWHISQL